MTPHQLMVDEFHKKFLLQRPNNVDFANLNGELRIKLMQEELDEFKKGWLEHDPVQMIDALCDLLYVTYGTAVSAGVNIEPYFAEVHRSNMSKLWPDGEPHYREDGKLLKPPDFKPPDIATLFAFLGAGAYPGLPASSTNPSYSKPSAVGRYLEAREFELLAELDAVRQSMAKLEQES